MKSILAAASFAVLLFTQSACAQVPYDGRTGTVIDLNKIFESVGPGTVLIISEIHTNEHHHQFQRAILAELGKNKTYPKSVGMEFLYLGQQNIVDQFINEQIDEASFLTKINWSKKMPFDFYRYPIQFPHLNGGTTLALNFPMDLAAKVREGGLDGLSDDDKKFVPPNFELGRDSYFTRFKDVMKDHATPDKIAKYFIAQSLWDDTMAYTASEFMRSHPDHLLAIIVGDFHVAYQDGLIARLRKRGVQKIVSISQVDTTGLNDDDRKAMIAPDSIYGVRADFVIDAR